MPLQYCPGGVDTHELAPTPLWPPIQSLHSSTAPVERVFASQTTNPVLSSFALVPAAAVLQKALPAPAYLPTWRPSDEAQRILLITQLGHYHRSPRSLTSLTCVQLVHSPLPPRLILPGAQSSQEFDSPSAFLPAPQYSQTLCASSPFTNPKVWLQSTQTDAAIAL